MVTPIPNIDIPVIDGRTVGWQHAIDGLLSLRKNFLLILPETAIGALHELFQYTPAPLPKWDIVPLKDLVAPQDFEKMQTAVDQGDRVFLIELLKLPNFRPPNVRRYAAYCDYRGIFADSDSFEEAKAACEEFSRALKRNVGYSIIRVFEWTGSEWVPMRVPC